MCNMSNSFDCLEKPTINTPMLNAVWWRYPQLRAEQGLSKFVTLSLVCKVSLLPGSVVDETCKQLVPPKAAALKRYKNFPVARIAYKPLSLIGSSLLLSACQLMLFCYRDLVKQNKLSTHRHSQCIQALSVSIGFQ